MLKLLGQPRRTPLTRPVSRPRIPTTT